MGLRKGQTNNLNGRPKGSQNKNVSEHRQFMKDFVEKFFSSGKFQRTFEKLKDSEKMKVCLDLMQYVTPKLASVSNEVSFTQLPEIILKPAPEFEPISENGKE